MTEKASSVQFSCSVVSDSVTPWTAACQASLSITNSGSPPKPMSIELMMPSNHLILCRPLLLLPSIFPSIRVFSNESALLIRWPKYWSFSLSISPSNEHPGLISFRMDWLDLLAVQGLSRVFSNTTVQRARELFLIYCWCSNCMKQLLCLELVEPRKAVRIIPVIIIWIFRPGALWSWNRWAGSSISWCWNLWGRLEMLCLQLGKRQTASNCCYGKEPLSWALSVSLQPGNENETQCKAEPDPRPEAEQLQCWEPLILEAGCGQKGGHSVRSHTHT